MSIFSNLGNDSHNWKWKQNVVHLNHEKMKQEGIHNETQFWVEVNHGWCDPNPNKIKLEAIWMFCVSKGIYLRGMGTFRKDATAAYCALNGITTLPHYFHP